MKTKILKKIKEIEEQYDIKIIFAIESGSRSWNFASKDSDYDVRCVHVSKGQRYLAIDNPPEQIDSLNEVEGLDICSWDIKKFMKLFYKSNPSCSEWMNSNIIYIDSFYRKQLKEIFQKDFSKYTLKKHYVSMARQNYEKYIRNKNPCSLKKYVYVLRALACVEYLLEIKKIPPIKYNDVAKILPEKLRLFFEESVKLKKASESKAGPQNEDINREIEKYFDLEFEKDDNKFDLKILNAITKNIIVSQGETK